MSDTINGRVIARGEGWVFVTVPDGRVLSVVHGGYVYVGELVTVTVASDGITALGLEVCDD